MTLAPRPRCLAALIVLAATLAACGGGGSSDSGGGDNGGGSPPRIATVKVAGDSLADAGTFGVKATVQSPAGTPTVVWPDVVTAALQAPALCPRYSGDASGNVVLKADTRCTSYAVAGAQINPVAASRDGTGYDIVRQLRELGSVGYAADELLLVDGGGNDAAALMGAYVSAFTPSGYSAYIALLGELLTPAQLAAVTLGDLGTLFDGGTQYMVALADLLADTIESQALARGARRVAVMNLPNVVRTPRFQQILAAVALLGGQSAADRAATAGTSWVRAYNTRLAARLQGRSELLLVDVATELDRWIDTPAAYGFSNATQPVCPVVGQNNGLPSYDLPTCMASVLSANPPAGASGPDWWRTYVFADNFHGTPRTNQLIGELFVRTIQAKGWN